MTTMRALRALLMLSMAQLALALSLQTIHSRKTISIHSSLARCAPRVSRSSTNRHLCWSLRSLASSQDSPNGSTKNSTNGSTTTDLQSEESGSSSNGNGFDNNQDESLPLDDNESKETHLEPPVPSSTLKFRTTSYDLTQAAIVGALTGFSVALFKLSIEAVREFCYQQPILSINPLLTVFIPAAGGLVVGSLLLLGAFPPGLRGTVKEVDQDRGPGRNSRMRIQTQLNFLRKSVAAIFTLGTGCSLGPEGPCVEIGMSMARACMDIFPQRDMTRRTNWNLLLLSCGAAAGVASGFNAPLAGTFFAIEIMQKAFAAVRDESKNNSNDKNSNNAMQSILSTTENITPVLLASVLAALISRALLGNHLVLTLTNYSLKTPLIELPLYLLLGAVSGFVAFFFSRVANLSKSFFDGDLGADSVRSVMHSLPPTVKPLMGGLLCGIVGLFFPQILFFGYETLNSLLANTTLPTTLLLSLLFVKTVMTAVSAGSGLVGGTFAPALFLGAMVGASFHNIVALLFQLVMQLGGTGVFQTPLLELADVPAYAMVGAASVLAALFRAPLTASLLLFELTRDYDVILPLMASAGVGSVVGDILEEKFELAQERRQRRRRDQDSVSWGDLSDWTGK